MVSSLAGTLLLPSASLSTSSPYENYINSSTVYYIQRSEIQENIDEIECIFYIFTSENMKFYIYTPLECRYNFFGVPLTFP